MSRSSILVKLGGAAATSFDQLEALARELVTYDSHLVIVHGGGKEVSELSLRLGLEPVFHEGIRMTSEAEMDVVEMVLGGVANKRLVRRLVRHGLRAVGISGADGGLVTGGRIRDAAGGASRTARIASVDPRLVNDLWQHGYVPVLASPSSDERGEAVNINADDVAFALAGALGVASLVFLSDVPGVLIDGEPAASLTPAMVTAWIEQGAISGGMIPKATNAVTALEQGVDQVVIGRYEREGDLARLLDGSLGTAIIKEGER
jgi:acetylglutamate kinase